MDKTDKTIQTWKNVHTSKIDSSEKRNLILPKTMYIELIINISIGKSPGADDFTCKFSKVNM